MSTLFSRLEGQKPDLIWFDESHYAGLKERPAYQEKKRADANSYLWDELIEHFITLGDPAVIHANYQQENNETEQALRLMAAESRFRRRLLVETLKELMLAVQETPGKRRARLLTTKQLSELIYIFLVVPKTTERTYEEYRRYRVALLHAYCRCAKLKFPDCTTFIGIALDHPVKDCSGFSEDLLVYMCKELTDEARAEAEHFRQEIGILGDGLTMHETHHDEFPQVLDMARQAPKPHEPAEKAKKNAKRKKRIATASRRRNRRR